MGIVDIRGEWRLRHRAVEIETMAGIGDQMVMELETNGHWANG